MGRIVGENKHKGTLYPVDSKAIYRVIYEVVAVLPTENIKTSVIYCVPIVGKDHEYDMYLYIDGWSKIGSGSIDLSDYYTKEEVDDKISDISTLSFKIVQEKPTEDIDTNVIYLIPKSESETGNIYEEWIYINEKWELLGTTDIDLSGYMSLAPLNPTSEQIAAMPSGQLYGNKIAQTKFDEALFFKLPRDFYYEGDLKFYSARSSDYRYPIMYRDTSWRPLLDTSIKKGSLWFKSINKGEFYILSKNDGTENGLEWQKANNQVDILNSLPIRSVMTYRSDPYIYGISGYEIPPYCVNDLVIIVDNGQIILYKLASWTKTYDFETEKYYAEYNWKEKARVYTKTEIDSMVGDIETLLSEV